MYRPTRAIPETTLLTVLIISCITISNLQLCELLQKFKKVKKKSQPLDISYFRLSLIDFLSESHPERLEDNRFIISRTNAATESYEQAIRNGETPLQAIEQANAVLFKDLHFSKYDTIVNILWNEFDAEVSEDDVNSLATTLLPECESIFAQYPLSDNFAYEPEYELLYTELTGIIALYLESSGIQ